MEISLITYLIVCPLVFLGGFVDAIAGGGGLITLPAYLLAGVPVHNALATNKLSSVMGASVSAFRFWKNRFVDISFILPSIVAALIGSAIGARITLLVPGRFLEYLLMAVLPLTAYMVFKPKSLSETPDESISRRKGMVLAAIISFIVGGYDGFYGPGTGTFLVLLYSSVAGMDVRNASGGAKMVNFASNISAFVLFLLSGKTLVALGLTAAVFSIAGHWFGAGLAIKKGSRIVRPVVLVVLALLLLKIISGR
ncbi:hypothetical protein C4J81_16120 [Deltaproteobacteria bacterium Smac51]|nr:hypothetical protein C4J81_16120 [Deltaproteobacteria bacterium Smac51]